MYKIAGAGMSVQNSDIQEKLRKVPDNPDEINRCNPWDGMENV